MWNSEAIFGIRDLEEADFDAVLDLLNQFNLPMFFQIFWVVDFNIASDYGPNFIRIPKFEKEKKQKGFGIKN